MTVSKDRDDAKLRITKMKVDLQQAVPDGSKLDEVVSALLELAYLYQNEIIIRNNMHISTVHGDSDQDGFQV